MAAIAISRQNCTGVPIQSSKSGKRNKRNKDLVGKKETIIKRKWHRYIDTCRKIKILCIDNYKIYLDFAWPWIKS